MNEKEIDEICGFLLNLTTLLEGKKQALILHEPVSTALGILFEGEVNKKASIIVKVFSTEKAGFNWLTA